MKRLFNYKFTLIVIVIILYGLLMPGDAVPDIAIPIPHFDKVVHFCLFLGLTITFYLEYFYLHHKKPQLLYTLLSLLAFALATEVLQGMITTSRMADPFDLLADLTGVGLAILIFPLVYKVFDYCLGKLKSLTK